MVDRKKTVFTFIALSIGIGSVVLFYCGIGWGFRHEAIMMRHQKISLENRED